jgi:hypothetical protein
LPTETRTPPPPTYMVAADPGEKLTISVETLDEWGRGSEPVICRTTSPGLCRAAPRGRQLAFRG